ARRGADPTARQQLRTFLDMAALEPAAADPPAANPQTPDTHLTFRRECLNELAALRAAGPLQEGSLDLRAAIQKIEGWANLTEQAELQDAEGKVFERLAEELNEAGKPHLAQLLMAGPLRGSALLVAAAQSSFRRQLEHDPELAEKLALAQTQSLS